MAEQLTVEQLSEKYSDTTQRRRLLDFMHLKDLLTDCIITKDYLVTDALHGPLDLTEHGKGVSDQARRKGVPFQEARLLCLLELFGADLLIDIDQTNIDVIVREISNHIRAGKLLYPFANGDILYSRMATLHEEPKSFLSSDETQELLQDTPQGVFQMGRFVTGPYGLLQSDATRLIPATKHIPLQSCADVSCDRVHFCHLSTDYDAPINQHYATFRKVLERKQRRKRIWTQFLATFAETSTGSFDDTRYEPVLTLIGDALDDFELKLLLAWLLDHTNGRLRELASNLGIRGRSEQAVSTLNRAEILQVVHLCKGKTIAEGIDSLVLDNMISVPPSEIRRTVVNHEITYGRYQLDAEISQYGVRINSRTAAIAPLRLRRLIHTMYDFDSQRDREEIEWQLRSHGTDSVEERVSRYIHSGNLHDLLAKLALARKSNVIVASEQLAFRDDVHRSDEDLVNTMMWKLGFDIESNEDPNFRFLQLHDEAMAVLRQHGVGLEADFREKLRKATVNYFVELEYLLESSLCFVTWALTTDHIMQSRPFVYQHEKVRDGSLELLNVGTGEEEHHVDFGELNSLYALCRGYGILGDILQIDLVDKDKYTRSASSMPGWVRRQALQRFPFRHTRAFLDLADVSQERIISELKDVSRLLVSANISEIRNRLLHASRSTTELEYLTTSLEIVRDVISRLEGSGFCRLPYRPLYKTYDSYHRSRVVLANARRFETEIFVPTGHEWLRMPATAESQYIMSLATLSSNSLCLRFSNEPDSRFSKMWAEFPRRPVATLDGKPDTGLGE